MPAKFEIDLEKKFPTLANPPIVEAALYWNGDTAQSLGAISMDSELASRFSGYLVNTYVPPLDDSISIDLKYPSFGTVNQFRVLLSNKEDDRVVLFQPERATFSQLKPYPGWSSFCAEGMRFWEAYSEILKPQSLTTLGLRFTSQVEISDGESIEELVQNISHPLLAIGLPPKEFFHRESAVLPRSPYCVDLTITKQSSPQTVPQYLLVDIDVQTTQSIPNDREQIRLRLAEMRYIKNAMFFGCMKNPEARFGLK